MNNLLLPFSWLYGAGVALRNAAFDRAWLGEHKLPCTVISVGNITVGGTGKTPMVIYLAEKLRELGAKPGILSRGYRRKSSGTAVVSDGKKILMDHLNAGDEPALTAQRVPKVPIVVDNHRVRGGAYLSNHFHPDVILLDDGFQHRWLHRDLDILLLDARFPFSNGKLLPAGRLRESVKNLQRANVIIITRISEQYPSPESVDRIRKLTDAPIIMAIHKPIDWISLKGKTTLPITESHAQNPMLLSGIAHPDDFEKTVRSLGIKPAAHLTFSDHQRYGPSELNRIAGLYRTLRADAIYTTEKDMVKLPSLLKPLNIWALRISIAITDGEDVLIQKLTKCIENSRDKKEKI